MFRNIAAALLGYVVWTAVFFLGNATVRAAFPGAHDDAGISRDPGVLAFYLLVSMAASLCGGFVTAKIASQPRMRWVVLLVVLLLATGIPVQIGYWDVLPLWYHLAFLGFLAPVTLWGGTLAGSSEPAPQGE